MSSSLFSYSPISIKLGLYHSLLSTIYVSIPLLLCIYISTRYDRKYIIRSYLALTLGQTLFSLFLYYGPYPLTALWSYLSPIIAILGSIFTYKFVFYLYNNKKSVKYPTFFYLYFFGIMFLNPIRFGTSTSFFLNPDLLPFLSIFYFISYSLVFFFINTSIGLLVNEISKTTKFYYMPYPDIQNLVCYLLATPSVLFWMKLPIAFIYWYPLRLINTPEDLPEFISNKVPTDIRIARSKNDLRTDVCLYYNKGMTLFKSADYFNVRIRYKAPNPYIYQKLEWYIDKKEFEIEEDDLDLRFFGSELIYISRIARRVRTQYFDPFFVSIRLFIRTPKNLNIQFQPIPRKRKIHIGEYETFKTHTVEQNKIKYLLKPYNRTFLREISWVRTLVKNPLFPFNRIENIRSSFLPFPPAIENLFEQKLINDTNSKINSIYSKNTIEYLKFATQEKILDKNQINRNTLTKKELRALNILSEKIVKKQIVSFVSNISETKHDLNSMIQFLNRPIEKRIDFRFSEDEFQTELGAKQVLMYELFLQSKKKNLIESIFKNPFGILLQKEFKKLLLSNLNNSNIPDDFDYISSTLQRQYNLNKYQKVNTVLLNDLIFIETGFTKLKLRSRQPKEPSVDNLLNLVFGFSSIKKSNKVNSSLEKKYYSPIKLNNSKRNLISAKTKKRKNTIFSDFILYPISSLNLDKKTIQHPTLIPSDFSIIRPEKQKILAAFVQGIKHFLIGKRVTLKPTKVPFSVLYDKTLQKLRVEKQLNIYKELLPKVDMKGEIEALRKLPGVKRKKLPLRFVYFYVAKSKDRKYYMGSLLLKPSALNIKLKTIESKAKNFKLKDYKSYTSSLFGKFF
jgi:hypothetical protein